MAILGILLGLLPGFAWLFFYLQEDLHPEPKSLIALTFLTGMASALFVLPIQIYLNDQFGNMGILPFSIFAITAFAFVEELFKFGAAYLCVRKNPAFDEPVDAMIYMIVAALGFATVENVGAVGSHGSQTALVSDIFELASLRFIGATLLHSLTAGAIGYFWALSIRDFGMKRLIAYGLALATLLHVAFNYLILSYGSTMYAAVFLLLIGFFVLHDFEMLKKKTI